MTRRLVFASLALLAVAGCSSSSSGGGGGPTTSPTLSSDSTSPSASASTSPTSSPSPTPTPSFTTTVKAAGPCTAAEISVTLGQSQGSAGHTEQSIVFANVGSTGCTLYGHPGASFLDSSGAELGQDATFDDEQEATVTLAPGGKANAPLSITDPGVVPPAQCDQQTAAELRVYPPGIAKAYFVKDAVAICTSDNANAVPTDGPVTPGSGG